MLARGDGEDKVGFVKKPEEYEEAIDKKLELEQITEDQAKAMKEWNEHYKAAKPKAVEDFNDALE